MEKFHKAGWRDRIGHFLHPPQFVSAWSVEYLRDKMVQIFADLGKTAKSKDQRLYSIGNLISV